MMTLKIAYYVRNTHTISNQVFQFRASNVRQQFFREQLHVLAAHLGRKLQFSLEPQLVHAVNPGAFQVVSMPSHAMLVLEVTTVLLNGFYVRRVVEAHLVIG